jgi:uncharacterized protein (DUF427 family)
LPPKPDQPAPGQESVWCYPRPAVASPSPRHISVVHRGVTIASSRRCIRTLETSHPPSYYIPREHVTAALHPTHRRSFCEWKGEAIYFDVVVAGVRLREVAWSYPNPTAAFASLRDHLAFYPAPFDACTVDGEPVTPQQGGFYGGWITSHVAGPFKGVPGSTFW